MAHRKRQTNIRLSERERRALELLAEREERTLSEFLRELIRKALKERGFTDVALTNLIGHAMIEGEAQHEQQ